MILIIIHITFFLNANNYITVLVCRIKIRYIHVQMYEIYNRFTEDIVDPKNKINSKLTRFAY